MTKKKKDKKVISGAPEKNKVPISGSASRLITSHVPYSYYDHHPSWCFNGCDPEFWSLYAKSSIELFWSEVVPHLRSFETQKWSEILIKANKQNHSIDASLLNSIAFERLTDLKIEHESIISLRLNGTHRLYGFITDESAFSILWFDTDHGDNDTCVCRSKKKHT